MARLRYEVGRRVPTPLGRGRVVGFLVELGPDPAARLATRRAGGDVVWRLQRRDIPRDALRVVVAVVVDGRRVGFELVGNRLTFVRGAPRPGGA